MANPNQEARGGRGRYHRTPENIARDTEIARLYYDEHLTYRQIGKQLGMHHSSVIDAVRRVMREAGAPAKDIYERRAAELQFLWDSAMEVLNNHHVVVSNGRVVELDGAPLQDDAPRLQAIEQLRKVNAEWRKLDGTDAPSRVSVEAEQLGKDINKLLDTVLGPDGDDTDA